MYSFLLSFHNIFRWIVLVVLVITVVRMFAGWLGKKEWSRRDEMFAAMLPGLLDLQLLVGGILYFLVSPLTRQALSNFSAAMADSALRFFAIDHASTMLVGVILAHVSRVLSKKSPLTAGKFRWAAIGFGLTLLVILLAIPWPFSSAARPWLRIGSFLLN